MTTTAAPAGAGSDNNAVGSAVWGSPGNIVSSNDTRASVALTGATSHYLFASTFDFSAITAGSTINGIQVDIERSKTGGGTVADSNIRLMIGGSFTGNNKSAGASWAGSDQTDSFGGSSDLWGTTPAAADVKTNDTTFGVGISATCATSATALVDYVSMSITWTAPGGMIPHVTRALAGGMYYGSPPC